ncbi:MAG: phenylacetate-CoA oxygenase subunit PaaJ [Phycisphaerales bacterium]|nr:phenylacetate-CoA oxygenase subunit PaaJ [Phycisphaerales bacterium]
MVAAKPTVDSIRAILGTVIDPEMPIDIVNLGLVHDVRVVSGDDGARAEIDLIPTFIGCPALDMIRDDVRKRVTKAPGVVEVAVRFLNDPPWSIERITPAGREALREFGVTTPERGGAPRPTPLTIAGNIAAPVGVGERPACPFCGSAKTRMESAFGPTRCKMIFYCDACKNSFEHLKPI